MDQSGIVNRYYANNGKRLHIEVDKILRKFGGITDPDHYYSLANEIFVDLLNRYDGESDFNGLLYVALLNKFKTEQTRKNRFKRRCDKMSVSIDTPIGDGEKCILADCIESDFDINAEIFGEDEYIFTNIEKRYFSVLSNNQRKIITYLMEGYTIGQIKNKLHITDKKYNDCVKIILEPGNLEILRK